MDWYEANKGPRANRSFLALAIAAGLSVLSPGRLPGAEQLPHYRVTELEFVNLLGERLLTEEAVRMELADVLAAPEIYFGEPERGITRGFFRVPNPFAVGDTTHAVDVRLRLELERADYLPGTSADKQVLAFATLGLVGLAVASGDSRLATVQLRVTAYLVGDRDSVEAVGMGFAATSTARGPRRLLIPVASRRALYDSVVGLAQQLAASRNVSLHEKRVQLSEHEFRDLTDGPRWRAFGKELRSPDRR